MVKGKTKSGIKFQINEAIKDDTRTLYLITKMQNSSDPMEQGKALFDLLNLLFDGEEGVVNFMDEVAAKHNGICSPTIMVEELTEMFESTKLKNS